MLAEALQRAAGDYGDRAAFVTPEGRSLSFEQLEQAARQVAAGLRERGLGEGSVVGLVLPSAIDYVAIYLGAARIGAVTAGINPLLTPTEANNCIDALRADLIVTDPQLAHLVDAGDAERVELIETGGDPAAAGGSLRSEAAPRVQPSHTPGPDDERPVCICFTSGSTGAPKAAWFANRQLRAVAEVDSRRRVGRRPRPPVHSLRPRRLHDQARLDAGLRTDHASAGSLVGGGGPGAHSPSPHDRGDRSGAADRADGPAPVGDRSGLLGRAGRGGRRCRLAAGVGAGRPRALRCPVLDPLLVHRVGRRRSGHVARRRRRRGLPLGGPSPPRRGGADPGRKRGAPRSRRDRRTLAEVPGGHVRILARPELQLRGSGGRLAAHR